MPRSQRIDVPGSVFHITAHGVDGADVFRDNADRQLYLGFLGTALRTQELACLTYVLMSNHIHLMLMSHAGRLSEAMQRLHGRYAQRFNGRHGRRGALWARRFDAEPVTSDRHLREAIAYIADNPVRAGMCTTPDAWAWGGHTELSGLSPRRLVDVERALAYFASDGGDGRTQYLRYVASRGQRPSAGRQGSRAA